MSNTLVQQKVIIVYHRKVKEMEYLISDKTLNKIVSLMEDKPFKTVINLLNEIKAVPYCQVDGIDKIEAQPETEIINTNNKES